MSCLIKCNQFIFHPLPVPSNSCVSLGWQIRTQRESALNLLFLFSSKRIIYLVFSVSVLTHCHCYYVRFSASYFSHIFCLATDALVGLCQERKNERSEAGIRISALYIFIFAVCAKQNDKLIHFDGCRLSGNLFFPSRAFRMFA